MIIINLKSYSEVAGGAAVEIARMASDISSEFGIPIIIAPSHYDINACSKHATVYAQHVDALEADRNTGYLPIKLAKLAGAKGSLLNHSEHRIGEEEIEKAIMMAKKEKMKIVLCAKDHKEAGRLARHNPYAIAVEPPELIAGDISVSKAKPEVIMRSVEEIRKVNPRVRLLVGAGIKNSDDVRKSLELGAKGILIASGVVFAKNKRSAMLDMIRGFQK